MSVPGFFTAIAPYQLPHPPIPQRIILTTHVALVRAFEILRASPPSGFALSTAKEDEITRQLHWIIENRLLSTTEVAGFDRRRIKTVIRAPEVTNYDGKHPARKPDLVLFLLKRESFSVLHSHDGIFVECKPVDDDHPIASHYCGGGIKRFVEGEYAWTMQEGMLVAYVRGGRSISTDLKPVLATAGRFNELGRPSPPTEVSGSHASQHSEPLQETEHERSFAWPAGRGNACRIRLFHSWHDCS